MPSLRRTSTSPSAKSKDAPAIIMTSSPSSSSSSSTRRSSRRSGEHSPSSGLSAEETAFSVLRQYVLVDDFKSMPDPDNVMTKIWVRAGKEKEDDGHGVDWVKEDGFTVEKYEKFWRTEMADMDDVIVGWGYKLPAEAKAHLPKELFKDDAAVAVITPVGSDDRDGSNGEKEEEKTKKKKPSANNGAKRGRKKKQKRDEGDEDGLTPELLLSRAKWFGALEGGRVNAGIQESKASKVAITLKKKKELADRTKNLFQHNVSGSAQMTQYKKESLDPVAKRTIAQVDEYVSSQAAVLRNDLLESLRMTNYKFTEEE